MMGSQAHKNEKPTLLGSSNKPVVLNSSKLIHSLHQAKAMKGKSPCLTRTRAKENGHWLLKYNRFMSHTEILALMGASDSDFPSNVVAPNQLRAMAGNAVPIPLFQRVIEAVLSAAGL